jgi:hypothetical protein
MPCRGIDWSSPCSCRSPSPLLSLYLNWLTTPPSHAPSSSPTILSGRPRQPLGRSFWLLSLVSSAWQGSWPTLRLVPSPIFISSFLLFLLHGGLTLQVHDSFSLSASLAFAWNEPGLLQDAIDGQRPCPAIRTHLASPLILPRDPYASLCLPLPCPLLY